MIVWQSEQEPTLAPVGAAGWLRASLRAPALVLLIFGGLGVLLLIRLLERPVFGLHRPWTPFITQIVCRSAFFILGMGFSSKGTLMTAPGAVVANHCSWLDILALNARKRIYFVSKSEVAGWPGIGWLARATGTVFITRNARAAREQKQVFEDRLKVGHKLLFFPEGTSTDGLRVLQFKSTLFAAFFAKDLPADVSIQPVTVRYSAPRGEAVWFYGWWGGMGFAPHLLRILAIRRHGAVEVRYHSPLRVADFADRKALAAACEAAVRSGM